MIRGCYLLQAARKETKNCVTAGKHVRRYTASLPRVVAEGRRVPCNIPMWLQTAHKHTIAPSTTCSYKIPRSVVFSCYFSYRSRELFCHFNVINLHTEPRKPSGQRSPGGRAYLPQHAGSRSLEFTSPLRLMTQQRSSRRITVMFTNTSQRPTTIRRRSKD